MRIKVYTIELKLPRWLKRTLAAGAAAAALAGVGAVVRAASVPSLTVFNPGDTLSAASINANFKALQDAVNAPVTVPATSVTAGALPSGVTIGAAQVSGTVQSAATCTTCGAAGGALETRIAAIESKKTGGNFAEGDSYVGVPTVPLLQSWVRAPTSGFVMAVATTRVCAFEGDYWLALSTTANDVPLTGRSGPYGFARAVDGEKYCESVAVSRTFPVPAGLTTVYLNVKAVDANGAEFVAPTLNLFFYEARLE